MRGGVEREGGGGEEKTVIILRLLFFSSDLWALGCIIYQFLAGRPPFHAAYVNKHTLYPHYELLLYRNEYLCFQKIIKHEYSVPEGFPDIAKDLVEKLLVSDATLCNCHVNF